MLSKCRKISTQRWNLKRTPSRLKNWLSRWKHAKWTKTQSSKNNNWNRILSRLQLNKIKNDKHLKLRKWKNFRNSSVSNKNLRTNLKKNLNQRKKSKKRPYLLCPKLLPLNVLLNKPQLLKTSTLLKCSLQVLPIRTKEWASPRSLKPSVKPLTRKCKVQLNCILNRPNALLKTTRL